MTDQEKQQFAASIWTAKAQGKITEWKSRRAEQWQECNPFKCVEGPYDTPERWRIKPEPVTRPWSKPEDVVGPIVWIRVPKHPNQHFLMNSIDEDGVWSGGAINRHTWAKLAEHHGEYSTDRKTWQPCVVTEEPK